MVSVKAEKHLGLAKKKHYYSDVRFQQNKTLTLIVAVKCKDGIVICSDTQETVRAGDIPRKDIVSKIKPIDTCSLLACSGGSSYISVFVDKVKAEFQSSTPKSTFDRLDSAIKSYARYAKEREDEISRDLERDYGLSAIFATVGKAVDPFKRSHHVYELIPPDPPRELTDHPFRIALGSGSLSAIILLRIAEHFLSKMAIGWDSLSTGLVSQFCYMLLGRVMGYDLFTGISLSIWKIDDTCIEMREEELWPERGKRMRLSMFAETALEEFRRFPEFKEKIVKDYLDSHVIEQLSLLVSKSFS